MILSLTTMSLTPLAQSDLALSQICLIATDMDGTLTLDEKFTPALFAALQRLQQAHIDVIVITGRSAGWVSAVNHYFPVFGAICENGGILYHGESSEFLVDIDDVEQHRHKLADMFEILQAQFPQIQESSDNRFRITDWTFNVAGLSLENLHTMAEKCEAQGWSFTYSTVQCHIKPLKQDKATGLNQVLQQHFPHLRPDQLVTVGDSPNDVSLFNPEIFPNSVGVNNISGYADRLTHLPRCITALAEGSGFCELADWIIKYQ